MEKDKRVELPKNKKNHLLNLRILTGFWHGTYFREGEGQTNKKKLRRL
jgi:hypothetical protein